jgi:hypothetical protein
MYHLRGVTAGAGSRRLYGCELGLGFEHHPHLTDLDRMPRF